METRRNTALKGVLIFTLFSFVSYLIIVLAGIVLDTFGFSCNCFKYTAITIASLAMISFAYCWYNSCSHKITK